MDEIRDVVMRHLENERETIDAAMASIRGVDASERADGDDANSQRGDARHDGAVRRGEGLRRKNGPTQPEPQPTVGPSKPLSIPARVLAFVTAHPGARASDVMAAIQAEAPNTDPRNVFSALYRLTRPDGPVRAEGTRNNYTYSLKEVAV